MLFCCLEFLNLVAQCLSVNGYLATYSCAAQVRNALKLAGLNIGSVPAVGRKSPSTIASFRELDDYALSLKEKEHLETRAAIPYRDPSGQDTSIIIHQRRLEEQHKSVLEITSQWKKRWDLST